MTMVMLAGSCNYLQLPQAKIRQNMAMLAGSLPADPIKHNYNKSWLSCNYSGLFYGGAARTTIAGIERHSIFHCESAQLHDSTCAASFFFVKSMAMGIVVIYYGGCNLQHKSYYQGNRLIWSGHTDLRLVLDKEESSDAYVCLKLALLRCHARSSF